MSTDAPRTRGTGRRSSADDQWFATSPMDRAREATGKGAAMVPVVVPAMFLIHAKRLGTTVSACGVETATWHKYWTSFHRFPSELTCRSCIAEVAE